MPPKAVTFDFGQTLTELDCQRLHERLAEKFVSVAVEDLHRSVPAGWRRYDEELRDGRGGHPWHVFMSSLLAHAGVAPVDVDRVVPWLFVEQQTQNLWRAPIPGMIELVRALGKRVPVGVISNSEGRLAELAEELGYAGDFVVIADSGLLDFAKPGREIFEWTAARMEVQPSDLVHVGDSWSADVLGALGVGAKAIWFGGASSAPPAPACEVDPQTVALCRSAEEVASALRAWDLVW